MASLQTHYEIEVIINRCDLTNLETGMKSFTLFTSISKSLRGIALDFWVNKAS